MRQSIKSIKAQLVNDVALKYKRQIEQLKNRNKELETLCAKYKKKLQNCRKA